MKKSTVYKKFYELGKQAYLLGSPCTPEKDYGFVNALPSRTKSASTVLNMYFAWVDGWEETKLNLALREWAEEKRGSQYSI